MVIPPMVNSSKRPRVNSRTSSGFSNRLRMTSIGIAGAVMLWPQSPARRLASGTRDWQGAFDLGEHVARFADGRELAIETGKLDVVHFIGRVVLAVVAV